ncbi:MAG: hypothetical protein IJV97_04470 [Alphaproteobacteria bacterium]|nr:hypothetical protein [Alphaproteobacteria bacterium]
MELSKEKKAMLASAQPITRRWLMNEFKKNYSVTNNLYNYLNLVESNIYRSWHQDCLSEMKRIKLNTCVPDLFDFVANPDVNLAKALSEAQKRYARETNKTRQKHIGKMISMLQTLATNEKKLYRDATNALINGASLDCLDQIAMEIYTNNEVANEYILYTKQSIKHYNRLVKLGRQPSIHELYQALDPRSAADVNIHTAQVNIICATYQEGKDVPEDIKAVCFEHIAQCIQYTGYFHVALMEYIFKNDMITEQAFQLFEDSKEIIVKTGMAIMPKAYAHRLAKKKGLYDKPAVELSDSDLRILRIEQMFS